MNLYVRNSFRVIVFCEIVIFFDIFEFDICVCFIFLMNYDINLKVNVLECNFERFVFIFLFDLNYCEIIVKKR